MLEAEDDPPKASSTSDASAQEIDQNSDPHLADNGETQTLQPPSLATRIKSFWPISILFGDQGGFAPLAGSDAEAKIREDEHQSTPFNVNEWPEAQSSWLSYLLYMWVNPLIHLQQRRTVTHKDIWRVSEQLSASYLISDFSPYWQEELERPQKERSLFRAIHRTYGIAWWASAALIILWALCYGLFSPILIHTMLSYVSETGTSATRGVLLACGMFLSGICQTFAANLYYYITLRMGTQVRSTVISLLYQKALRLSVSSRNEGVGEILNLMSNDVERLVDFAWTGGLGIACMVQLLSAVVLLYIYIGWPGFVGVGALLSMMPLSHYLAKKVATIRLDLMKITDARVKWLAEVLQGIRLVKFYAYEENFSEKLRDIREAELSQLSKLNYIKEMNTGFVFSAPLFVTAITLLVYAAAVDTLTTPVAFTVLAVFSFLRVSVRFIPQTLSLLSECQVAIGRMEKLLAEDETEIRKISNNRKEEEQEGEEFAVSISKASFSWKKFSLNHSEGGGGGRGGDESVVESSLNSPTLFDIDLKIRKGELIAIIGEVGSGKSSLLAAILGEIHQTSGGEVSISSSKIAYVTQQSWIFNGTVRENIVFGSEFQEDLYWQVIESCALLPDLEQFANSDLTEIGERGVNLSGGQKQRISLARAVYSQPDIFFFDDPLSAVDSHVGRKLFGTISGQLRGSTRLLVTHQLYVLSKVDRVVVMSGGKIERFDTYDNLLRSGFNFRSHLEKSEDEESSSSSQILSSENLNDSKKKGPVPISVKPQRPQLERNWTNPQLQPHTPASPNPSRPLSSPTPPHMEPIDAAARSSPNLLSSPSITDPVPDRAKKPKSGTRLRFADQNPEEDSSAASTSAVIGKSRSTEIHIQRKHSREDQGTLTSIEERTEGGLSFDVYKTYVFAMGGTGFLFLVILLFVLAQTDMSLSDWWLSRWSASSDSHPLSYWLVIYMLLSSLYAIFLISRAIAIVFAGIRASRTLHSDLSASVFSAPVGFFNATPVGRILNRFSKDMQYIDEQLSGSLHQLLMWTFSLIASMAVVGSISPLMLFTYPIVAFIYVHYQSQFRNLARELRRLDSISRSPIFQTFSETIGGLDVIRAFRREEYMKRILYGRVDWNSAPYSLVFTMNRWLAVRLESVGAIIVFLAALTVVMYRDSKSAGMLGFLLNSAVVITGTVNGVVRWLSDMEIQLNAVERVMHYANTPSETDQMKCVPEEPPQHWPSEGRIELRDVYMKYREDQKPVLNGVNCSISAQEKIGVVGRTGAGKSSLVLAIFRLIELSGGSILIDGVDISKLDLFGLRSRLSIIPQDPVLFTGTIRSNLDPPLVCSDERLWEALRRVQMSESVSSLDGKLDAPVAENGANFSVGQRQLLCLARALVKKTKIIVLDEATAAIDANTDAMIQQTIRKEFSQCTLITIAHRLDTILDSDRILVMDQGRVAEFDTPQALTSNESSRFASMLRAHTSTVA